MIDVVISSKGHEPTIAQIKEYFDYMIVLHTGGRPTVIEALAPSRGTVIDEVGTWFSLGIVELDRGYVNMNPVVRAQVLKKWEYEKEYL